jgi:bacteriocin biosynthesis cyclodehydratase domain-containing protein
MILRLDPGIPLVWRTPDSLQLGIDRPLAVFTGVTPALEQVVAALRIGIPPSAALLIGEDAGAYPAEINALLRVLRPALLRVPAPGRSSRPAATAAEPSIVCVDGNGPTAERIADMLKDLGFEVEAAAAGTEAGAETGAALAVIVGHYVLEPERHGHWLRRDIPHLPVLFSDSQIRLGPLVEPGIGPCLYCLELRHVDDDPAWPAMAVQLVNREARTENVRNSLETATRVAGIVADRLDAGRNGLAATTLLIDAQTRRVKRRANLPHERCGCRSLPENVTVLAGRAGADRRRPSSVTAAGARA